ncbi:TylF/MycF/NovP-related O-methyltransferase [Polynucleobacter victoriensis]|uniref:O-methyltransferase n=1 Tax=Polynucleobacter victoriensis TaxID=2049319 RepID=A0A212T813_9BURK|nr:TylF/MycF/NovP-related O-methyltransferase [Polynucleobacter victoriensis]SNC62193.1 O-methyltransferase [Polynucleobacter victoriensis]
MSLIKKIIRKLLPPIIIDVVNHLLPKNRRRKIPDKELYAPLFSPWLGLGEFKNILTQIKPHTLVSPERIWILYSLARQAKNIPGNFWECGVYKGGTGMLLANIVRSSSTTKKLRLFDTFCGMPSTHPKFDLHKEGDFSDNSLEAVKNRIQECPNVIFHQGLIPETFSNLDAEKISFAHIDVDIYQSILDCCEFIYPKLSCGGVLLFDDYGFPSCPGARLAVDQFFKEKPEVPIILPTGQAFIIKVA